MIRRGRLLLAAALSAVLLVTGCGLGTDVEGVLDEVFERSSGDDDGTAQAWTTDSDVSAAVSTVSDKAEPVDRVEAGDATYLRYDDHIARFAAAGAGAAGTLVLLDGYESGRQRWFDDVGQEFGPADSGTDDDGK